MLSSIVPTCLCAFRAPQWTRSVFSHRSSFSSLRLVCSTPTCRTRRPWSCSTCARRSVGALLVLCRLPLAPVLAACLVPRDLRVVHLPPPRSQRATIRILCALPIDACLLPCRSKQLATLAAQFHDLFALDRKQVPKSTWIFFSVPFVPIDWDV